VHHERFDRTCVIGEAAHVLLILMSTNRPRPRVNHFQEDHVNPNHTLPMRSLARVAMACAALSAGACAPLEPRPATGAEFVARAPDYQIGPGDAINIIVWRNPEVSMTVTVRPDGKISTPLVEDLSASGRTPTELAREIEKSLAKVIQQPAVTVVVTTFVGQYQQQIRVIGQAAKPQALQFRQDMSLMDVLISVGGMTEFASGNRANIVRTVNGQQQTIRVRLNDLLRGGDLSANVRMFPGDVLVIPEGFF
jgi:polysaccharide export outer membrane protein